MGLENLGSTERLVAPERPGRPFKMTEGSAKERQQAMARLYEKRARAIRERPGSSEDSETERMLGFINTIIKDECTRVGLVDGEGKVAYEPVTLEEVQGVPRVNTGDAGDMVYDYERDIVQYELGQPPLRKFVRLLHESIHTTQSTEFAPVWRSRGASAPEATLVRAGYMTGEAYRGGSPTLWKWCNEAVVHGKTLELIRRNVAALTSAFPGTTEEEWLGQDTEMYGGSMRLLDMVTDRFAQRSGADVQEVRDDFFRRHVSGDMSHLERLDEYFGPGTFEKFERVKYDALDRDFDATVRPLGI